MTKTEAKTQSSLKITARPDYRLNVRHVADIYIYIYIVMDVPDTSGQSKNNIGAAFGGPKIKTIQAEKYQGLYDAVVNGDLVNVGRKIILPPTIYGTPRFYSEAFMDAMTIVRKFGKPDFFITFTTNPKWLESREALFPGESPHDRPDLAC